MLSRYISYDDLVVYYLLFCLNYKKKFVIYNAVLWGVGSYGNVSGDVIIVIQLHLPHVIPGYLIQLYSYVHVAISYAHKLQC